MKSGQNPYEITRFDVDAHAKEIVDGFDAGFEGRHVSIAGRIMRWRDMGKANFIDLQDGSGRMPVYVKMNKIGEEAFRQFGKWSIGRHRRCRRRSIPHPPGQDLGEGGKDHPTIQEPAPAAREVARPQGYRCPVPPALCGPHGEP